MPLFGAHMSAAGGAHCALEAASGYGMDACQLFTKSNQQWRAATLTPEMAKQFHQTRTRLKITSAVAHSAYLINLASENDFLRQRSIQAMIVEMQRAERLGLEYLVVHPGAATDGDAETGLERVADAVDLIHKAVGPVRVQVLLETTAGQGRSLGHQAEHLGEILQQAKTGDRLGVCLDICHVFAAGYPLSARRQYLHTMRTFDRLVGLERIRMFHVNDSAKPLGSRVDRHAHIGYGHIGEEAFGHLVRDRRFRDRPMILETPKGETNGTTWDAVNLATLRRLWAG